MSGETRPGEVYKGPLPKGTKRLRRRKTESEEDFNLRKAKTRKEAAAKAAAARAAEHTATHPSDHPLAKFARVWSNEVM
jgi:ribosome assembly protein YihI (activator of Der GTPase)